MAIPILDANGQTQQLLTDEEVHTITDALDDRLDVVEDQLEGLEEALHLINTGSSGGSSGHTDTRFTLDGGTVETHNITGTLDQQWMIDNGYYDGENYGWIKTITQADIGNTVTSIGDSAFGSCPLTSVTIPDSVMNIGSDTFSGCNNLTNVTIPSTVTSIGEYAFIDCSGLTSMTIPDNVTSIGFDAFYGCDSLTSVTIVATGKPGASAASVKQAMIDAGVDENITWNMPS